MTTLHFPANATTGTLYTGTNGVIYTFDGIKWIGNITNVGFSTSTLVNGSYSVSLGSDGTLTFPGGSITYADSSGFYIESAPNLQVNLESSDKQNYVWVDNNGAHVGTSWNTNRTEWLFNLDGTTSFPNYTFPYLDGAPGEILVTNGNGILNWVSTATLGGGSGNGSLIQSSVPPLHANTTTLWYDTVSGRSYVYYANAWIDANPETGVPSVISAFTNDVGYLTSSTVGQYSSGKTGNIAFTGTSIYSLSGVTIENADLLHGATAAVIIPSNGSVSPIQLNNIYGGIVLQSGTGSNITASWGFNFNGSLTFPDTTVQNTAWTGTVAWSNITNVPNVVGQTGATGTAATIQVGTVTVSTTTASVTNVGTTSAAILDFVLQQGPKGDTGPQGPQGSAGTNGTNGTNGAAGTPATIQVGTVSVSTTTATITNVGTSSTAILNFVLLQGPQGSFNGSTSTQVSFTNSTQSAGTGSGALIVSGGVGIAKNLNVGGEITVPYIVTTPVQYSLLPNAALAGKGARAFVTDATVNTFGTAVTTGSGVNNVPVYSNGISWYVG